MPKVEKYRPLHILCCNGWKWLRFDKDKISITTEYEQYAADFLGSAYSSTVVAIVSEYPDHLDLDGHYGVLWLEAVYENERNGCLSWGDMKDMMCAIDNAEENLLMCGMPFVPVYEFHGRNKANKKRKNEKLRKMYDMESIEQKDWERSCE